MKFSELSKSEKRLVGIVVTLLVLLINVVVLQYFARTRAELARQLAQKTSTRDSLQLLADTAPLWEKRAQWLQQHQPKLADDSAEGNALLTSLKESASKHGLSLSKQQLPTVRAENGGVAVPVQFELKGNWKGICSFLSDLQTPERFVVIQQSKLRVDATDATQMQCDFTIAKWFAPR